MCGVERWTLHTLTQVSRFVDERLTCEWTLMSDAAHHCDFTVSLAPCGTLVMGAWRCWFAVIRRRRAKMCIQHMLDSLGARPSVVSNGMKSSCCFTDCSCRRRGRFHSATWHEYVTHGRVVVKCIYHSSVLLFSTTVKLSPNANVVRTLCFLIDFFQRDGLYPVGFISSNFCILSALFRSFPLKIHLDEAFRR